MAEQDIKVINVEIPGAMGPAWIVGAVTPWDVEVVYVQGNAVLHGGKTYRASVDIEAGIEPPASPWELIAEGGDAPAITLSQRLGAVFLGG